MNEDIIKIIYAIAQIIGVLILTIICVLVFGKTPRIKKLSVYSKNSHEAKLQRNKFAYMNKHS